MLMLEKLLQKLEEVSRNASGQVYNLFKTSKIGRDNDPL